jgi:hypothetical protein
LTPGATLLFPTKLSMQLGPSYDWFAWKFC